MKATFVITFFTSLFLSNIALAQVFVKPGAAGSNDGTSWQNAYTNLDTALSRATAGQIWVAAGTYKPSKIINNVYQSFLLNKPLTLVGGFNGTESNLNQRNINDNPTILSGDIGIEGDNADNTPRVITVTGDNLDSSTCIDGFIITKAGYPTNGHGYDYDNGGIYISRAGSPVIRNCTITENSGDDGSGICVMFSNPLLINNNIVNNQANAGAGIYISYSDCKIENNKIQLNSSTRGGGGILIDAYSAPIITGNLIEGNTAGFGGAIAFRGNYSIKVINNIISNNSASSGGAIYIDGPQANIINNLIVHNYASSEGGAIYAEYTGASTLINNTIANNHSDGYAGALRLGAANIDITNTIFHNNTSAFDKPIKIGIGRIDWFPKFRYCNIQDSINSIAISGPGLIDSIWREGNTAREPLFADTVNYNFHLDTLSTCINSGMPDVSSLELPLNDIDNNIRVVNNVIDKGCYEFYNTALNVSHLKANPTLINLQYGWRDTMFNINVLSDIDWRINNPEWVSISPSVGNGNTVLSTSVNANPSQSSYRSALLLLSSSNSNIPSIPIKIIQPGADHVFAKPDTLYIGGDEGDTASFMIYSDVFWSIPYSPWLTFSLPFAFSDKRVIVKAKSNSTGNERKAIVNIFGQSMGVTPTDSIVVIQRIASYKLCAGGNSQILSGLTGNLYQWQVDTGSGFVNITDNANYTGSNTSTLQLNNTPSQWYGYKFRCIVDGTSSNIFTIKFQNTWTGTVDSTWENPQNWSCGVVPDENTDVKITSGQVSVNSNVIVRSIMISNNALLAVMPGFNVTVVH